MRKIREVLRLSLSVGLPRSTVRRYVCRAADVGLRWPPSSTIAPSRSVSSGGRRRRDVCESADPESKGVVERSVDHFVHIQHQSARRAQSARGRKTRSHPARLEKRPEPGLLTQSSASRMRTRLRSAIPLARR